MTNDEFKFPLHVCAMLRNPEKLKQISSENPGEMLTIFNSMSQEFYNKTSD